MASIPVSLFLPSLISSLGEEYHGVTAQLMTIPVSVFTCLCTLLSGWGSDKLRNRPLFMIIGLVLVVIGYIILLLVEDGVAGRLVALFLTSLGPVAEIPTIVYVMSLQNRTGWTDTSKKFASSAIVAVAALGGIFAPLIIESGLGKDKIPFVFLGLTIFGILQIMFCWWFFGSGVACQMSNAKQSEDVQIAGVCGE